MLPTEVDYLIVGAGARGMAFADEIVHHDPKATVVVVDRRQAPGGHWVDAYPYVRLHQPALYYGVGSTKLGSGGNDLASKPEIIAYYARVMETLQATGRCHFLLGHDYEGDGHIRALSDPERVLQIKARRLVDSVYIAVSIPSTRPPPFPVDPSLTIVPLNALAQRQQQWERYVVIGAGKTGMDAVLYLLAQGIDPDAISWVVSRDAWLINRDKIWPQSIKRIDDEDDGVRNAAGLALQRALELPVGLADLAVGVAEGLRLWLGCLAHLSLHKCLFFYPTH